MHEYQLGSWKYIELDVQRRVIYTFLTAYQNTMAMDKCIQNAGLRTIEGLQLAIRQSISG
jgi:hypothetical protein